MIENPETGALENFDFEQFKHYVPEFKQFNYHIDALAFDPPIDSSDMEPRYWIKMAHIIADHMRVMMVLSCYMVPTLWPIQLRH